MDKNQTYERGTRFVEFADGTFAEYINQQIIFTEEGKKLRLTIYPSRELVDMYGLYGNTLVREYNYEDTHICRDDPSYGRIWIFTDFNGKDTSLSLRCKSCKEGDVNENKRR